MLTSRPLNSIFQISKILYWLEKIMIFLNLRSISFKGTGFNTAVFHIFLALIISAFMI